MSLIKVKLKKSQNILILKLNYNNLNKIIKWKNKDVPKQ